jgi:hypothetical protein
MKAFQAYICEKKNDVFAAMRKFSVWKKYVISGVPVWLRNHYEFLKPILQVVKEPSLFLLPSPFGR